MHERDFDELFKQAHQIGKHLAGVYREVTGEDLDLESAIRHYPLFAVGLVAGAGALGGYWMGRRAQQKQLPPPKGTTSIERLRELNDQRKKATERGEPLKPIDFLEHLLPPGTELEDAAEIAKEWVTDRLEPRLREGMESVLDSMAGFHVGSFLKQAIGRADQSEDRQLEDPEDNAESNFPEGPATP